MAPMDQRPANKLVGWKNLTIVMICAFGTVLYRTYRSYERKGHVNSLDLWAAAIAIMITSGVAGLVAWWANREE